MKSQDHWMSKKELGKVPRTKREKIALRASRRVSKPNKYHKVESKLVFWSKKKIIMLGILIPWKWKLGYSSGNNVAKSQFILHEKGKGSRFAIEATERRLRFQEGYFFKKENSFMYLYIFKKGE